MTNTASRLIVMAAALAGSLHAVMSEMRTSEENFRQYVDGAKEPPWPELDRLISLIVREQQKLIARNRAAMARARDLQNK